MERGKHNEDVSTTSQESASGEKQLPARYQVLTEIGEDFFHCWDRDSGKCARLKVIKNTSTRRYGTDRGIALMQYLSMSGVRSFVRMNDYFYHQKQTCIVFETLGPSLFDLMKINISSPVPLTLIVLYARQLLESVADLHELGVIHTDLKPENIQLVSSAFEEIPNYERTSKFRFLPTSSAIKLFVLSAMFEHNLVKIGHHRPVVTTRNFRAPEVILGLGWYFPVDLWSVGCVLAEMCTGQRLFRIVAESDVEHLALFERVLGKLPKNMTERLYAPGLKLKGLEGDSRANINSHEPLQEQVLRHVPGQFGQLLIDLLKGLLEFEPSKRLTARRALQHQVFRDSH